MTQHGSVFPVAGAFLLSGRLRRWRTEVEQCRGGNAERIGQLADVDERDIALAALNLAQIRAGEAAFERKVLLRPIEFLAKLDQTLSKQHTRVVIHRGFRSKDALAYGFDLFNDTLYSYPRYK